MPIAEAVANKVRERAEVGYKKYGVTADRDDLSFDEWLNHLQEELLDAAVYIEKIRKTLNGH